jgi:hypothetical protein
MDATVEKLTITVWHKLPTCGGKRLEAALRGKIDMAGANAT